MGGPVEQALGRVLRRLRRERGLSQERLAELLDGNRGYVSLLERGVNSPTISMVFALAVALGVSPGDFVTAVEDELSGEVELPPPLRSQGGSRTL